VRGERFTREGPLGLGGEGKVWGWRLDWILWAFAGVGMTADALDGSSPLIGSFLRGR
jgi:hypothetical protein